MKALVTGATGFIGSVIVKRLLGEGHTLRALVLEGEDTAELENHAVEIWRGDLTAAHSLIGLCNDIDIVFHCAARVTDWGTKEQFYRAIFDTTRNLINEAAGKISRFVYLSSMAALGLGRHLQGAKETDLPKKSGVPYNDAKADTEKLVMDYHNNGTMECVIVRPANVTGPGSVWVRDPLDRFYSITGLPLMDHGKHSAALVYIDNLVDGIIRAATVPAAAGKTYHFRDDWEVSWKRYISDLGSCIEKKPGLSIPFRLAWPAGRILESFCNQLNTRAPLTMLSAGVMGRNNDVDTTLARQELGWETIYSYEEAMAAIRAWINDRYKPPRQRSGKQPS